MKPPPFDYAAPSEVREVVALLGQHGGEAKLLAGGQSLMPLLNMRLARPSLLVDLRRVEGLAHIRETENGIAIGAMVTKRALEDSEAIRSRFPHLHAATRLIAHPAIRNRGTIGGSLVHADPAAEYPALALLLGAELLAQGPGGERRITAENFYLGYLTTALDAHEVLLEVRFPKLHPGSGWSIQELARRPGDFALAGVMTLLTRESNGTLADARIVTFGVGPRPQRAAAAEALLRAKRPEPRLFESAAKEAAQAIEEPLSDVHASGDYRRHLVDVLVRRSLEEAGRRAEEPRRV